MAADIMSATAATLHTLSSPSSHPPPNLPAVHGLPQPHLRRSLSPPPDPPGPNSSVPPASNPSLGRPGRDQRSDAGERSQSVPTGVERSLEGLRDSLPTADARVDRTADPLPHNDLPMKAPMAQHRAAGPHAGQPNRRNPAAGQTNARPPQRSHHPRALPLTSAELPPNVVRIRNLAHISDISGQVITRSREAGGRPGRAADTTKPIRYEISQMPITEVIEMVAGLLSKIAGTNDRQYSELHQKVHHPEEPTELDTVAAMVLAFHGKNVPAITVLAYLLRIEKYCPTTYEVFLSLLVYFDRMTATVNSQGLEKLKRQAGFGQQPPSGGEQDAADGSGPSSDPSAMVDTEPMASDPLEPQSVPHTGPEPAGDFHTYRSPPSAMDQDSDDEDKATSQRPKSSHGPAAAAVEDQGPVQDLSEFFVVDSYNIHRLVIASVAAASKFFSDIFYTNTRLAKVGGLPLVELNHLELQFLRLNNFRLAISVEELESYGTMLVEFYAREVQAQNSLYDEDDDDDLDEDDGDLAD